jgi:N utilization substance protein A
MKPDPSEAREVCELFRKRVPSIASGVVTIRGAVRDPGSRTVLAVVSTDPATDAVGSCVGMRGAALKDIVKELHREHIDIVLWNDSAKRFVSNLFAPMQFLNISFDESSHQATAVLNENSLLPPSKTIELKARLLRQLTGWVLQFEMEH